MIEETSSSRLSLKKIERSSQFIDPVFLNTPQFQSDSLSRRLELDVVLKVETVNPIRSFKGRGAEFLVSCLPDEPRTLVCASAGNFGQGVAYAARKRAFRVVVFAAQEANPLKVERMRELGAEVRLFGENFDAAKAEARRFAESSEARFIVDGREPEIAEGAGTISVELCAWGRQFDAVLVPLGDGALVAGIGRWMKAHSPATRIVGVCAAGAPAVAMSWREGKLCSTETSSTIADGIDVRVPVPESLLTLASLMDEVLLVEDESLIEAMRLAFDYHGLVIEPAGAAGLAAAIAHKERFRHARVAIPLCGGNLTSDQVRRWLLQTGHLRTR
jgi:threonine dehydratase